MPCMENMLVKGGTIKLKHFIINVPRNEFTLLQFERCTPCILKCTCRGGIACHIDNVFIKRKNTHQDKTRRSKVVRSAQSGGLDDLSEPETNHMKENEKHIMNILRLCFINVRLIILVIRILLFHNGRFIIILDVSKTCTKPEKNWSPPSDLNFGVCITYWFVNYERIPHRFSEVIEKLSIFDISSNVPFSRHLYHIYWDILYIYVIKGWLKKSPMNYFFLNNQMEEVFMRKLCKYMR